MIQYHKKEGLLQPFITNDINQKLCFIITALSYLGQNTNETVWVSLKYCVNRRFKSKCFRFSKLRKCNLAVLQTVSGLVSWCSNRLWPSYFRIIIPFHMCTRTSKKSTTFDKIPRFANIIIDVRKKDPSKKFMIAYKTICHTINNDQGEKDGGRGELMEGGLKIGT